MIKDYIVDYNPTWPTLFDQEAIKIKEALGRLCLAVHHTGSTSVPGLSAKPTIDILLVIGPKHSEIIDLLHTLDYKFRGEYNIPLQLCFTKRDAFKVNLHAFEEGHPEIELNLSFRDYLRNHESAKKEYADLKQSLLQQKDILEKNGAIFSGYNLGKNAFISRILAMAGFEKERLMKCTHHAEWEAYHNLKKNEIFDPIKVPYDFDHNCFKDPNHHHFVLYKGSTIVAAVHTEFLSNTEAALRAIAVGDSYKNRGFGTTAIYWLEKWLKAQNISVLKLHSNIKSEGFYRKLGYDDMQFDDPCIIKDFIDLGKKL